MKKEEYKPVLNLQATDVEDEIVDIDPDKVYIYG